jgi:hypothetical protein
VRVSEVARYSGTRQRQTAPAGTPRALMWVGVCASGANEHPETGQGSRREFLPLLDFLDIPLDFLIN